jgi:hypothetical protein
MNNKVYTEDGNVYFKPYGQEPIAIPLEEVRYSEGVFILPNGVCIPEDSPFACEQEVFAAWHALHADDPEPEPPGPVYEPIDDEKVAMAEAIIDMDARIAALEGGV